MRKLHLSKVTKKMRKQGNMFYTRGNKEISREPGSWSKANEGDDRNKAASWKTIGKNFGFYS